MTAADTLVAWEVFSAGGFANTHQMFKSRALPILAAVLLLVAFLGAYSISGFVLGAFARGALWGWGSVIVLSILSGTFLRFLYGETRAYLRLRTFERLQKSAAEAVKDPTNTQLQEQTREELLAHLLHLETLADPSLDEPLLHMGRQMDRSNNADEWTRYAEEVLLSRMDEQARSSIRRESLYVACAAVASPYSFIDAGIFFWRAGKLITEVARAYRVRAGFLGTIHLIVRTLSATAMAMLTQEFKGVAINEGGRLLEGIPFVGKLLVHTSHGVLAGSMVAWIGIEARRFCRPLPVKPEDERGLVGELFSILRARAKEQQRGAR